MDRNEKRFLALVDRMNQVLLVLHSISEREVERAEGYGTLRLPAMLSLGKSMGIEVAAAEVSAAVRDAVERYDKGCTPEGT